MVGSLTRFPDTTVEAMVVSEGVREMPAVHPPELRRLAFDLVARANRSARLPVIWRSVSCVCASV